MKDEPLYSVTQCAYHAGISRQGILQAIKACRLFALQVGSMYVVTKSDLDRFLKSRRKDK